MPDNQNQFSLGATLLDPTMKQNMASAMSGIPEFLQGKVQNDTLANAAKNLSYTAKGGPNGTEVDVHTDFNTLKAISEAATAYQGIRAEYDKMLAQNAQQMAAMRQHPFANTLAQIAAGLAQTDTNPLTRGIGVAASRLNPTMDQMQKERMGLLQGQEGALGGEGRLAESVMAHQDTIANRNLQKQALIDQKKSQQEQQLNEKWMTVASHGAFNPKAFETEYKMLHPEASAEGIRAVSEGFNAMAAQVKADKAEAAKEQDKLRREAKLDEIRAKHQARMDELASQQNARLADAKAKGQAKGLTGKELSHFQEVEAASGMLGELKNAFEQHEDLFNPAWKNPASAAKRFVGKYVSEDIQNVTSLYAHAVPIMIKLLGEGARGYAPQQRAWLETKAPKMSDTPEQIRGKIRFIQSYIDSDRKGTAKTFLINEAIRAGKMTPEQAAKAMAASPQDALSDLKRRNPPAPTASGGGADDPLGVR
jgi:hypothetical protein